MRNVRQAARRRLCQQERFSGKCGQQCCRAAEEEVTKEGGEERGHRTVSGNESWRRIAICNFMAASLETEGAQEQDN